LDGGIEMRPLTSFTSAPYALSIPDSSVTKEKIAANYVEGVSINGQKIVGKASTINLKSGAGIFMDYDKATNSVTLGNSIPVSPQSANSNVYWSENGNSGTTPGTNYVGTSDSVNFEIHAYHSNPDSASNTGRVMLFEPRKYSSLVYVPNITAGSHNNQISSPNFGGTISGGKSNKIFGNSDFSTISGGTDNQIKDSSTYSTIPGGPGLTAQSYSQTVMGRYNEAQGTSRSGSIVDNDRLLILGNGVDKTHRSNAFEVSNNGHSIVYHKNESSNAAIRGATYTDNIIYAWGYVEGTLKSSFGVYSVAVVSPGIWEVRLNLKYPDGSAMYLDSTEAAVVACVYGSGDHDCQHINIFNLHADTTNNQTVFRVSVSRQTLSYFFAPGTSYLTDARLNCINEASDFMFIVTGRPHNKGL